MSYNNIKSGDIVEISLKLDDGQYSKSYSSKVETVNNENTVLIQVPFSEGRLIKLPISDKYSMLFLTEDGMFRFDVSINSYTIIDGFRYISCTLLSSGRKIQRRQYFRYDYSIDFKLYQYINNKLAPEKLFDAKLIDIGGGGIKFYSNDQFAIDDYIQSILILNKEFVILDAKILSVVPIDRTKGNFKYQFRAQFVNADSAEREKIIQFIFNEQRKKLRRSEQ